MYNLHILDFNMHVCNSMYHMFIYTKYVIYYVSVTYMHICDIYDRYSHMLFNNSYNLRNKGWLIIHHHWDCVCVCMYNTQPQRWDGKPTFWAISTILPHSLSRLEGRCCFLSWELTIPNGDAECKQMSLSLGPLHFSAVPVKQGLMELLLKGRGDCP